MGVGMTVSLSKEMEDFVRERVTSGSYANEDEVIEEGLRLLSQIGLRATCSIEEFEALIEEGLRDFEEGRFVELDATERQRIKDEGRRLLTARLSHSTS